MDSCFCFCTSIRSGLTSSSLLLDSQRQNHPALTIKIDDVNKCRIISLRMEETASDGVNNKTTGEVLVLLASYYYYYYYY